MNKAVFAAAAKYLGEREIPGKKNNPLIVSWTRRVLSWATNDEISWCSTFLRAVLEDAGFDVSGANAAARSWLNVGERVEEPQVGDIVVLWRVSRSSWKGHVGVFVARNERGLWLLGGNQSNTVSVAAYPEYRVLSYRRVIKKQEITST